MGILGFVMGYLSLHQILDIKILVLATYIIYFVGMTYVFGATLGKILFKLKVENVNPGSLTISKVFRRESFKILLPIANFFVNSNILINLAILLIILVVALSIVFAKDKRGLDDKFAATVVNKKVSYWGTSLFPMYNGEHAKKYMTAGIIISIAILFSCDGFTNYRLINALVGAFVGILGGGVGIFFYYFILKINKSQNI